MALKLKPERRDNPLIAAMKADARPCPSCGVKTWDWHYYGLQRLCIECCRSRGDRDANRTVIAILLVGAAIMAMAFWDKLT